MSVVADPVPLPRRLTGPLWTVATLDAVTVAWMVAAGEWLDQASRVTAVVTLGGHHRVVLALALVGFALIAVLAAVTRGFSSVNQTQLAVLALAGVISVAALAGMISLIIAAIGFVLLTGLLVAAVSQLVSGWVAAGLLARAVRVVPPAYRPRYCEEWCAELHDLAEAGASRWALIRYAVRLSTRSWSLRRALRAPSPPQERAP